MGMWEFEPGLCPAIETKALHCVSSTRILGRGALQADGSIEVGFKEIEIANRMCVSISLQRRREHMGEKEASG